MAGTPAGDRSLSQDFAAARDRSRPRLGDPDFLHLRPLAEDLRHAIAEAALPPAARVLDLGCGASPYRRHFPPGTRYLRVDLSRACRPDVIARAESLPFLPGVFDALLAAQVLPLVDAPAAVLAEMTRTARPGATLWVSLPVCWPYDSARPEHRFDEPGVAARFAPLAVTRVVREGGMLAFPFILANLGLRDLVRALERRLGAPARLLRPPARAAFVAANLGGRLLERLAAWAPLAPFLGYLDRRLPLNLLVVAEKPR